MDYLLYQIEHSSAKIVEILLNTLWQGGIVVLLLYLIRPYLKKLSSTFKYFAYFCCLLFIFSMPFLSGARTEVSTALGKFSHFLQEIFVENEKQFVLEREDGSLQKFSISPPSPKREIGRNSIGNSYMQQTAGNGFRLPAEDFKYEIPSGRWTFYVVLVWLLISILFLERLVYCYIFSLQILRNSRVFPGLYSRFLRETKMKSDVDDEVEFRYSSKISVPLVVGFFRPTVLIPAFMLRYGSRRSLENAIIHELAHIRRRDNWTNLVQKIIEAIFFFNPAIHVIKNKLNLEREIACDDYVVSVTGKKKEYAVMLRTIANISTDRKGLYMALGAGLNKKNLLNRLQRLANPVSHYSYVRSLLGMSVMVLCLGTITLYMAVADPLLAVSKSGNMTLGGGEPLVVNNNYERWGTKSRVDLQFLREIGNFDNTLYEAIRFRNPSDISIDEKGDLYIADSGTNEIKVFNAGMGYRHSVPAYRGGKLVNLFIDRFDRKYSVFSDGVIKVNAPGRRSTVVKTKIKVDSDKRDMKISRDGNIGFRYKSPARRTDAVPYSKPLGGVMDHRGNILFEFGKRDDTAKNDKVNDFVYEFDRNGNIIVAYKHRNRIETYEKGGRLALVIDRKLSYKIIDNRVMHWDDQRFRGFTNVSRDIQIDGQNRIWVLTNRYQYSSERKRKDYLEFHVFNAYGRLVGKVDHPAIDGVNQIPFKIVDDRLFMINNADNDIIYEYRIIEK